MSASEGAAEPFTHVVVSGSSAGGIESLVSLVGALPKEFAAPIVLAQHQDPARRSGLDEILRRHSTVPVILVEKPTKLVAGSIYHVPAGHHVEIVDHRVQPVAIDGPGRSQPSIDHLFKSAASAYGERVIGVILSGMGSDGAAGARAIKEAGGTIVIQDPASAAFPSMPLSLAPNFVDIACAAEDLGALLDDLVRGVHAPAAGDEGPVRDFLASLRERTGIDFGQYKMPTIMRRLSRLIAAAGKKSLAEYVNYLQSNPEAHAKLASSFLIKVTGFFRDPDLFDYVRTDILPQLIAARHESGSELRIWSAGCATGEEAYSLAIMVAELLRKDALALDVRIFATDLDNDAIAFARRGLYPENALDALDDEVVERYFTQGPDGFEVKKVIRDFTIFGQHDLAQRAPFPRIDLALCRNVLIYFTRELQERALQLFAFALRSGGYLALGKAETTNPAPDLFAPVQQVLKVYRRQGGAVLIPAVRLREATPGARASAMGRAAAGALRLHLETRVPLASRSLVAGEEGESSATRAVTTRANSERLGNFLTESQTPLVVVDRNYDILSINTAARKILNIHGVAVGHDLIHLAVGVPVAILRTAIDAAMSGQSIVADRFEAHSDGAEPSTLQVLCYAERTPAGVRPTYAIILILDVSESAKVLQSLEEELHTSRSANEMLKRRADHLASSERMLMAANVELTDANARLVESNEYATLASEEAASSAEEIEILNEEMQATNEELETLNEELQATIEELNTTNDELAARGIEFEELAVARETARLASELRFEALVALIDEVPNPVVMVAPDLSYAAHNRAFDDMVAAAGGALTFEEADGVPLDLQRALLARSREERFETKYHLVLRSGKRKAYAVRATPHGSGPTALGVLVFDSIAP